MHATIPVLLAASDANVTWKEAYHAFGVLFFLTSLPVFYRILRGVHIRPGKLDRFSGVGRSRRVYTFTGLATDIHKGRTSWADVSGDARYGTLVVRRGTTVHDQFMLDDATGHRHAVQVTNMDVAVGNGDVVSVVWSIKRGHSTGPYLLVRNHATGRTYRNPMEIDRITFRRSGCLSLLRIFASQFFFPWGTGSFVALLLLGRVPRRRFMKGIAPLLVELDRRAAQLLVVRSSLLSRAAQHAPVVPSTPTQPVTPSRVGAGWHHDPSLRHEWRYFDGVRWTEHVNDQGRPAVDPVG